MSVPQTKEELLAAINGNYLKLIKDLETVPPDRALEKSLDGHASGTHMSVHDLVAYLVGWSELVLKWHAGRKARVPVDFPETGFKWNELGRLAQKFYRDYETIPFPELLQKLAESKRQIVQLVEGYDNAELYGMPWYEKWTMGRMIQFNTSSPYSNARNRLRKWKRLQVIT